MFGGLKGKWVSVGKDRQLGIIYELGPKTAKQRHESGWLPEIPIGSACVHLVDENGETVMAYNKPFDKTMARELVVPLSELALVDLKTLRFDKRVTMFDGVGVED